MDATQVTAVASLLAGLSIASERLVEVIKGFIPSLDRPAETPVREGKRKAILQLLAAGAGMATVYMASDLVPAEVYDVNRPLEFVTLGLLASGGSGLWNSVLTYASKAKDVKRAAAEQVRTPVVLGGAHANLDLGQERVTSNECYDVEE